MHNHAPQDYICPICLGVQGIENDRTMIRKSDIVYQDDLITVFISSFFFANNPGHPIIVPNKHYENIYELPDPESHRIISISRIVATALKKSHSCDGVLVEQNNEPASDQHAFHYHMHLIPRYKDDNFHNHLKTRSQSTAEERLPYANRLREEIAKLQE